MDNKKPGAELFRIASVLTLICTLVATLIAVVYALTDDVYQANLMATKQAAIAGLFEQDTVDCERLPAQQNEPQELYRVTKNGELLGFCANVQSAGFGGDIDMMVALSPAGVMLGVDIVAMSETPGLGSRVGEVDHLAQYQGLDVYTDPPVLGENVDAISGATISSKAVLAGVNTALDALSEYIQAEVGVE